MPVLAPRKAKERQCFAVLPLRHLKSGKSRLSMPRSSLIVLGMLAGLQGENRNRSLVERVSVFFFWWFQARPSVMIFRRTRSHTAARVYSSRLKPVAALQCPNSPLLHRPKPRFSRIGKNNTSSLAILRSQSKTLFAKPIYCVMILQKRGEMAYVVFN